MRQWGKRTAAVVMAAALALAQAAPAVYAEEETAVPVLADPPKVSGDSGYTAYRTAWGETPYAQEDRKLSADDWLEQESRDTVYTGDALTVQAGGRLAYRAEVPADGWYEIHIRYMAAQPGSVDAVIALQIDGETPFDEAAGLSLARLWQTGSGDAPEQDAAGNDIRPPVAEVRDWQETALKDPSGKSEGALLFRLSAGAHILSFDCSEADLSVQEVTLKAPEELPDYQEYRAEYSDAPVYDGEKIVIEAENTTRTSSRFMVAANDMSSPLTTPYDPYAIRLNTLSGNNWRYIHDTAVWTVDVPQEGWYRLSFRFLQNYYNGMDTHRCLYINGEIPFRQAQAIAFGYSTGWQSKEAGDYLYYLKAGENEIALEVVLGKYAEILSALESLTLELNQLYRRIIMVTGPYPDIYRDYNLEQEVPGLLETFAALLSEIEALEARFKELTGVQRSSELSSLDQLAVQIRDVIEHPASLTKGSRLSRFNSNISTLGAWANKIREQPLQLDSITVLGQSDAVPAAQAGFVSQLKHRFNRFIASFVMDYGTLSSAEGNVSLRVWVFSGRDQAQLLKSLIDNDFTPKHGIGVSVELVSGGIIEAMLAGKGPDVALGRAESDPVNYAMRNALLDLSQFEGFDEVVGWFEPGTMEAYAYEGGYYALPETQVFNMLFYRTDIFAELGLTVPETWDDLLFDVLPVLQQNNMTAAVGNLPDMATSVSGSAFITLLYQMGGQMYTDDQLTAALDTQVAYEAFRTAVEFYRDYGFPREYDFMNRFRTGEIPLGIAPYATYNNLTVGAPELNGLWEMTTLPGFRREDGTISNTQVMTGTASVINAQTDEPQAAWEFLRWWASADVQEQFGNNIEAVLGAGGRYTPANIEAMRKLPWSTRQLSLLEEQRAACTVLPQLPGSYFTTRAIYNAFVSSVIDYEIPREQLLYWNEEINLELARKREEFSFSPSGKGMAS